MVQHIRGSADWFRHRKRDLIEHAKAFDAFRCVPHLPADVDVEIRSALLSSAVVSYGKPFKESRDLQRRPLPRLNKNLINRQSGFDDEVHEELIDLRDKIVAHSDAAYVDARVLVKRLTNFTFERKRAVDDPVLGAVVMMNAVHISTDQNLAARMQAHVQSAAEAMIPLVEDELEDYARAANEFPGIFRPGEPGWRSGSPIRYRPRAHGHRAAGRGGRSYGRP